MESRGGRKEERKGECRCAERKGRGREGRGDGEGGHLCPCHRQPLAVCPPAPREPPACSARAGGSADRREPPDGAGGRGQSAGSVRAPPRCPQVGGRLCPRLGTAGGLRCPPWGGRCAREAAGLWGPGGRGEGAQQDPAKHVTSLFFYRHVFFMAISIFPGLPLLNRKSPVSLFQVFLFLDSSVTAKHEF